MSMLKLLNVALQKLPNLLEDDEYDSWNSMDITYHPPHVLRLWRQMKGYRLFLHRIEMCKKGDALYHPHPWPSAMKVIEGSYEMQTGARSLDTITTIHLQAGSSYEMLNRDAWHSVRPLTDWAMSVMVTGQPYENPVKFAPPEKVQSPLSEADKMDTFQRFQDLFK